MVFYRSCPKCKGDMHTRRDFYGDFKECLQCGLMQDLETESDSEHRSEKVLATESRDKHEAA